VSRSVYTHCIQCGKRLPRFNTQLDLGKLVTRSLEIANIDPEVRFCTLRCAAQYGADTAALWEKRRVDLRHTVQRDAQAMIRPKETPE